VRSSIFKDITPYSPSKVNRRFGETYRLHLQSQRISHVRRYQDIACNFRQACFILVSNLAYFSTLKMEATCFFETSVDLQRTTRRYISEDRTPHKHRCENLKSYEMVLTMVYNTRDCWFLDLFSSGILKNTTFRKLDVSVLR
jgi:hypothetical protein